MPRKRSPHLLWLIAAPYALLALLGPWLADLLAPEITMLLRPGNVRGLTRTEMVELYPNLLIDMPWYVAMLAVPLVGWLATVAIAIAIGIPGLVIYTIVGLVSGSERVMLVGKYLRKRKSPMFATGAVTLCTAMVIIVISIMGGFLDMLRDSAHTLTGDITVGRSGLSGFTYYEELADHLRKIDGVEAVTPIINQFGIIRIAHQNGNGRETLQMKPVSVQGIDPQGMSQVMGLGEGDTLYWNGENSRNAFDATRFKGATDFHRYGMDMKPPPPWQMDLPGMIPGIEVNSNNQRSAEDGSYLIGPFSIVGRDVTLTVVPITGKGGVLQPSVRRFAVVNEFKSGLFDIDSRRVYVPFDMLQEMLLMNEQEVVDENTGIPTGEKIRARASELIIKAKSDEPLDDLVARVQIATYDFREELATQLTPGLREKVRPQLVSDLDKYLKQNHPEFDDRQHAAQLEALVRRELPRMTQFEVSRELSSIDRLYAVTWEQQHGMLLAAVEKEKGLITTLFAFISIVAILMIAVIFYMIVMDKTWDIGVLRASGASSAGIVNIFLGYGLALGLIGETMGTVLATLVVVYINQIQHFLGTALGNTIFCAVITIGLALKGAFIGFLLGLFTRRFKRDMTIIALFFGVVGLVCSLTFVLVSIELRDILASLNFVMWDAQTYYFDEIPGKLNPFEVTVIYLGAVLSSVIGAVVPAVRAGMLAPVEALRYE